METILEPAPQGMGAAQRIHGKLNWNAISGYQNPMRRQAIHFVSGARVRNKVHFEPSYMVRSSEFRLYINDIETILTETDTALYKLVRVV